MGRLSLFLVYKANYKKFLKQRFLEIFEEVKALIKILDAL